MKLLSLVLALLGVAAIASAYQVRRDPCAWGPTYWCKSRTNAQQCRQVQYCRQNFWKSPLKMAVSMPKDTECDLCKTLAGYVDQLLKDNTTKEEVEEELRKLCSYLGNYEQDCNSMVNQYFNVIWEMLMEKLEPDEICARLGLCKNSTVAVSSAARTKTTSLKGQKECDDCTKIVDVISTVVNNSMTEEVAKEAAKEACDLLGPVASECKLIITFAFDKLWSLLSEELTPQEICEQLRLCSKNASRKFFALSKGFGLECSLCKSLIGEIVKKFVNTSSTEKRVMSMIEEACDALPNGSDQEECRTFIDSFFPTLWDLFMDDIMTPDEVCSFLGVCGNTTITKFVARRHSPSPVRRTSAKVGSELCDLCKEVDSVLKQFIDNANQSQVKQELKDLCRELPSDIATECSNYVDNYFDLVWMILKTYLDDPDQFCELIGLCNSTISLLPAKALLTSDTKCDVCKIILTFAEKFLARNSTEEEVLDELGKICADLPSDYADKCSEFVRQYGPTVYALLVNEVDPDKICSLIRACPSAASSSGELCEVCEDALSLVKSLLPEATDTVVSYLTDLCGLMPSAIQDECKDFVKQYGPDLIPLIAGLIDPDKDCQMIGLCSNMGVLKMRRRSV